MKVAGIVAEYDPFHNGHKYLIDCEKKAGATHIVVVMSGNFVQRGTPAAFPVEIRTRAALEAGADLVLQLPVNFAVSGAENFARGAVEILTATGIVDELCFGSESGNIEILKKASELLCENAADEAIISELSSGITYAKARENALKKLCPGAEEAVAGANNILGVEYIKALKKTGSSITPVTFKRVGAEHDSGEKTDNTASASEIRRLITAGEDYKKYLPDEVYPLFDSSKNTVDFNKFETAILYKMRTVSAEEAALAADVSEGIENRIIAAAGQAASLEELYSSAKTKRYTHARIRRIVLSLLLGITREDAALRVPYIRIMGIGENGSELVKAMKTAASLPVLSKTSDISQAGKEARRVFELESRATDIYSLIREPVQACGEEIRRKIIKKQA